MKPFNLADALAGKPVVTRNGRKVRKVVDVGLDITFPLAAVIDGCDFSQAFRRDGSYYSVKGHTSAADLFMAEGPQ